MIEDPQESSANGLGKTVKELMAMFYADDGFTSSIDNKWLQVSLQVLVDLFKCIGLDTNVAKTKTMTCLPPTVITHISTRAYKRQMTG